jgi:serine phosphatase RsbU (regulator of sigma subunit)
MTQPSTTLPSTAPAPPADPPWRERTLTRLVQHVRALLPVSAVAFLTEEPNAGDAIGWFADEDMRAALMVCMPQLVRTRPLLLPRVEAWEAAPELLDTMVAELGRTEADRAWAAFSGASVITCPVRGEFGTQLGGLVVASADRRRPLGKGDLPTVEALADLAAISLERTSLLEAEGRRARDELRLKRAAEDISSTLDPAEVYVRVAEHAASIAGGTCALLTRWGSRAAETRTAATVGCSAELATQLVSAESAAFAHVVRTRTPLLKSDVEDAPVGSVMHVPIELGPRLYGVLTVGHEERRRFGEDELELLVKLARSSAAAIANATDFQRERRIARALTLGFVPESLPRLPGYETGLLYAPAANEATGGDVYGAWPVGGGDSVAVLVGDVAGKGVEIAALSAMVRFFVEARSWDSLSPATILEQANAMLLGRLPRDAFVTAFLGILSSDSLHYTNAGHLPPLHVQGGSVRPLASHGLPLGVLDGQRYTSSELELAPGDLVFAHTDGLIEARSDGEMYGADRLARFVAGAAATQSPKQLVRAVHEEVMGWADGISDDAVALALRRTA